MQKSVLRERDIVLAHRQQTMLSTRSLSFLINDERQGNLSMLLYN